LAQVVSELITNAINHAFHEPHDAVQKPPLIELTAIAADGMISIEVVDNGLGITESDPARILDPFYSTKSGVKGTVGLGLFVAHTVVTQHMSGSMTVGNGEEGATISFRFPQNVTEPNKP
jgi:signal transduction histidine kinase